MGTHTKSKCNNVAIRDQCTNLILIVMLHALIGEILKKTLPLFTLYRVGTSVHKCNVLLQSEERSDEVSRRRSSSSEGRPSRVSVIISHEKYVAAIIRNYSLLHVNHFYVLS